MQEIHHKQKYWKNSWHKFSLNALADKSKFDNAKDNFTSNIRHAIEPIDYTNTS